MKSDMLYYKLTNGQYTEDRQRYLDNWQTLGHFLERIFDCSCIGFDPGFLMHGNSSSFDLPTWAAVRLYNKVMGNVDDFK